MPFTLQVTSTADAGDPETSTFEGTLVVIGRDASADLTLEDPARVVSKRHAEVRHTGEGLLLKDLGSKNGTLFNGRRLGAGEAVSLRASDAFEVGDFQICVERVEPIEEAPEPEPGSETRAAHDRPANHIISPSREEPASGVEPPAQPDPVPEPRAPAPRAPEAALVTALVDALARLAALPWHFRHEFIGQTIAPPEAMAVFAEGSPAALRRYLLGAGTDPEERAKRLEALAAAAEAGVLHQVAMLDGYKASIEGGGRHVLEALDPDAALETARQGGFWRRLPLLREAAALKHLRQAYRDLDQEDMAVAERSRFRPAFIKAYLARMTRRDQTPDSSP